MRIADCAVRTPLVRLNAEREGAADIWLKLENLQPVGSFKVRGAGSAMRLAGAEALERGVWTASAGNMGRAVAWYARQLQVPCTVVVPDDAPAAKVEAITRLGARVVSLPFARYQQIQRERDYEGAAGLLIHPFADRAVMAGNGTIGLEILEDLPSVGAVMVPLSGGGLLAGIALVLKLADPSIRTVGVSMERAPVMFHSLRAGRPIQMDEQETLADALAGGIGLDNRHTFRMVQKVVDETLLVTEAEIAAAMAFALNQLHLVVEGGGAVALAALMNGKLALRGEEVVVVLSGGNVEIPQLLEIAENSAQPLLGRR